MTDTLIQQLQHHAERNHSEEIRRMCWQMLMEIDAQAAFGIIPPPPPHRSQSILQSPESRAAYMQRLSRSLDAAPIEPEVDLDVGVPRSAATLMILAFGCGVSIATLALWASGWLCWGGCNG